MQLNVDKRTIEGKKVKGLRHKGLIPATIYSKKTSQKKEKSNLVQLDLKKFVSVYKEAGSTSLVTLNIGDSEKIKVLITDVQLHPISLRPIHAGFYKVDLAEKITANIPIEITDVDTNEIVKSGEGIFVQVLKEVTVESLPTDLPKEFIISANQLKKIGDTLTVENSLLKLIDLEKVKIDADNATVIGLLDYLQKEEVEETGPATVEDVEVDKKGKTEENSKEDTQPKE